MPVRYNPVALLRFLGIGMAACADDLSLLEDTLCTVTPSYGVLILQGRELDGGLG